MIINNNLLSCYTSSRTKRSSCQGIPNVTTKTVVHITEVMSSGWGSFTPALVSGPRRSWVVTPPALVQAVGICHAWDTKLHHGYVTVCWHREQAGPWPCCPLLLLNQVTGRRLEQGR